MNLISLIFERIDEISGVRKRGEQTKNSVHECGRNFFTGAFRRENKPRFYQGKKKYFSISIKTSVI